MALKEKKLTSKRASSGATGAAIDDPRFAKIQTDPRFRLPSKKNRQVKLDERFAHILKDDDFSRQSTIDRYGRKVSKNAGKKNLERFYKLDEDEEDREDIDDDDQVQAELARVERKFDPARDEALSSSDDDSSSSDESEEEVETTGDLDADDEIGEAVEMGEVSSRLAVVNLDWDNIRATDLMAVASSFVPKGGRLMDVTIYPSEFGRERMEWEELEGPPREIFKVDKEGHTTNDESSEDSESETEAIKNSLLQEDTGEEFNSSALRAYQLDRLKYYYAVLTCSSPDVGQALYEAMDGREYLSSANFFDMRFIPDEVAFDDDEPRDSCTEVPQDYKPNEFVTDALTHSKVKLTWDADDTTRKEAQKRAFSRKDIDENDLQAYIGSDSSDDDDDGDDVLEDVEDVHVDPGSMAKPVKSSKKRSDKAAALRAALGLGDQTKPHKGAADGPVGDMQITWTSGLSTADKGGVFVNAPEDETTIEKYKRKEKERKAARMERARLIKEGKDPEAEGSDESDEDDGGVQVTWGDEDDASDPIKADDPFDDPFFNDPVANGRATKKASKKQKKKLDTENDTDAATQGKTRDELSLLMAPDSGIAGDDPSDLRHFDVTAIEKAEKAARKKKGKGRYNKKEKDVTQELEPELQKNFKVKVEDPRFAKLFEGHEYAIDPTDPQFKATREMKAVLEEGRKRRKNKAPEDEHSTQQKPKKKRNADETPDDLGKLVERVKKRAKA